MQIPKFRYYYLYFFFLVMFLLLGFRYFQVQVLMDDKEFAALLSQFSDKKAITLPGWRGVIYTSDGIPVALTINTYVYYAIVDKLDEEEKKLFARSFSKVFNLPPKLILKLLSKGDRYVTLFQSPDRELYLKFTAKRLELWEIGKKYLRAVLKKTTLSPKRLRQICSQQGENTDASLQKACHIFKVLYWTGAIASNKRVYPHGRFLANTIGFVSKKGEGRAGIEKIADKYLYAGPVKIFYSYGPLRPPKEEKIPSGLRLVEGEIYPLIKKNFTADVYLTIDYTVQAILEDVKRKIVERWRPKKAVLFLMDAYTGEVLGLAVYPDFDPNKPFRNWQEFLNSKNIAFTDVFEMGSVIKPFFIGLAIYKGRVETDDRIYIDGGKTYIGRHVVRDAERLPTRYLSVRDILVHSSNVGVVQIARKLTKEDEEWLINLLGWNEKIVNYPGATRGLIPNLNLPANRLYIAFGQGLALTPAHLVSSYAALLTGYAPRPLLIKKVVREDGKVVKVFSPQYLNTEPLFDEKTRKWLLDTLRKIVVKGTGKKANPYYYPVGGKTGTAQVYDPKLRRYSSTRYVTSFIGFFPYPNPRYVLLVLVDEPKAPRRYLLYGGTVAAPYWAEIVNRVSSYLGITHVPDLEMLMKRR
ncbi:MAG TPA: penicillin-binding protein 2 [Aquificales bacterium]|nr:penicillin-binding protein 2 [Aquificales bacterium]